MRMIETRDDDLRDGATYINPIHILSIRPYEASDVDGDFVICAMRLDNDGGERVVAIHSSELVHLGIPTK